MHAYVVGLVRLRDEYAAVCQIKVQSATEFANRFVEHGECRSCDALRFLNAWHSKFRATGEAQGV